MQIDSVLIYDNENLDNIYPFSILHCGFELRCGCLRIFEKLQKLFPNKRVLLNSETKLLNSFLVRFGIEKLTPQKENLLLWNSSVLPEFEIINRMNIEYEQLIKISGKPSSAVFVCNGFPFAMLLVESDQINPNPFDLKFLPAMLLSFSHVFPKINIPECKFINYLWDAIEYNAEAINQDASFFENKADFDLLKQNGVYLIEQDNIIIGNNVKLYPNVVLNAEEGKIIIGNNVKIMPNSTIIGPCFVGDNSTIKVAAKIYEKTSIGEFCKIGGEVENTIFQAFSNKQHDGFIGHSFISEWVNLGADTNNSDLKNTYTNVKVFLRNIQINTRRLFMGMLCGDHTKSAINTSFNTGSVTGIFDMIATAGFPPKKINSFSFATNTDSLIYDYDKAIELAKNTMQRRNKVLTNEEILLIKQEYDRIMTEK